MQKSVKPNPDTAVKKNKQKTKKPKIVKTKLVRQEISANWKTFLSQQQDQSKTSDKKDKVPKPDKYTGPFRRARKLEGLLQTHTIVDETSEKEKDTQSTSKSKGSDNVDKRQPQITKYIAMDCEMVGVGDEGKESMLARISMVNKHGDCIYDKFVAPREEIIDYRTPVSGIRPEDLKNAIPFEIAAKEVADILRGKILVGHAIHHDLEALYISHPRRKIRDTSKYKPFRKLVGGKTPGLRRLAKLVLDADIQTGEHNSVEDAKAAMQLYLMHSKQWELQLRTRGVPKSTVDVSSPT